MFCPSCGTESNEQTKYCTKCGLDLRRVKGALVKGGFGVNEMNEWQQRHLDMWREEQENYRKRTPEEKRLNEIKGGIITSCVGLSIMIFLGVLFNAIANSVGNPDVNGILRAIPLAGLIPFLIGVGIIFNGMVIGKRIVEEKRRKEQQRNHQPMVSIVPDTAPVEGLLQPYQTPVSDFSITETTTTKLREPAPVPGPRDTK